MKKILIATSNPGKFSEITHELKDLKFDFVNLRDVGLDTLSVEEPYGTTWENALHKARTYARKSQLLTVADDSGIFIDALQGYPGVHSKRVAPTERERLKKILLQLKNIPKKRRTAYFQSNACLYNPKTDSWTMFEGTTQGIITSKITGRWRPGMEHDAIFYYPPLKKTFSALGVLEKNMVSHRGKVIHDLRIFLSRQYGFIHLVVPLAILIRNRKMLLLERRDSRKEYNKKWEFPGGGVEAGESVESCLNREVQEETGLVPRLLVRLPTIYTAARGESKGNYQVFLPVYVCKSESGKLRTEPSETLSFGWFTLEEVLRKDLLPLNKRIISDNISLLKKYLN